MADAEAAGHEPGHEAGHGYGPERAHTGADDVRDAPQGAQEARGHDDPGPGAYARDAVRRPGSDGEHALQERLGTAERAARFYDDQVLDHLNARMREFTQRQEMFFLATSDRNGECDSSFRAGPAGFLRVLDERTLVFPEYRGNGVHASLGNIQENPHLGIMLIDFVQARIGLHINGRAELVEDAEIRAWHPDLPSDPVPGRRAQLWVRVEVEEAYIHCAKHIPHLQKAPKRTARDWGTDDYKRKGGDFFGAARGGRNGGERKHRRSAPTAPAPAPVPATDPEPAPAPPEPQPVNGTVSGGLPQSPPPDLVQAQQQTPPPLRPEQPAPSGAQQPQLTSAPETLPLTLPRPASPPRSAPASAPAPAPAPASPPTDPEAWRQQAQRALAEAQRRAAEAERTTPFQGWFG
ncbi:pyridoxamine 5'-phosphate oxidase family protein [Streptomyces sp. NPDC054796]